MLKHKKKIWLLATLAVGLSIPLISRASNVGSLTTFTSGTAISSADVNANFTTIQAAVDSKQDALSASCASGMAVQAIAANGTATCATIPAAGATVGQLLIGNRSTAIFEATNAGSGAGLEGHNSSTNADAFGVLGVIDSSTPGTRSAAVRGNNMTTTYGGWGVWGTGSRGVDGDSTDGVGVYGYGPTGVAANSTSTGIALSIQTGGFQVSGAGISTPTAAFIHQTTALNTPSGAIYSWIDNPFANGNPNALLFVISNTAPANSARNPAPLGVQYNQGQGRWNIFNYDNSQMPIGANFNVLVIVP